MIKYKFDFESFLFDKRKSLSDLSNETKYSLPSLSIMKKRGTIKPKVLAKFEEIFGDCNKYVIERPAEPMPLIIGKYKSKKKNSSVKK